MDLTDSTKERKTSKEEKAKEMEDKLKKEKKKEESMIHPGLAKVRLSIFYSMNKTNYYNDSQEGEQK